MKTLKFKYYKKGYLINSVLIFVNNNKMLRDLQQMLRNVFPKFEDDLYYLSRYVDDCHITSEINTRYGKSCFLCLESVLDKKESSIIFKCGHVVCLHCLCEWMRFKGTIPECFCGETIIAETLVLPKKIHETFQILCALKHNSAIMVQRIVRGWIVRLRVLKHDSAISIQRIVRGWKGRLMAKKIALEVEKEKKKIEEIKRNMSPEYAVPLFESFCSRMEELPEVVKITYLNILAWMYHFRRDARYSKSFFEGIRNHMRRFGVETKIFHSIKCLDKNGNTVLISKEDMKGEDGYLPYGLFTCEESIAFPVINDCEPVWNISTSVPSYGDPPIGEICSRFPSSVMYLFVDTHTLVEEDFCPHDGHHLYRSIFIRSPTGSPIFIGHLKEKGYQILRYPGAHKIFDVCPMGMTYLANLPSRSLS